jgi:hypothetical protein
MIQCGYMRMTEPNYLTADQVAEKLQLNADVVRRMLAADKRPGKRAGRVWRTSAAALRELIEDGNETKSTVEPCNFQRDRFELTIEFSCYALGSPTISLKEKRIEQSKSRVGTEPPLVFQVDGSGRGSACDTRIHIDRRDASVCRYYYAT